MQNKNTTPQSGDLISRPTLLADIKDAILCGRCGGVQDVLEIICQAPTAPEIVELISAYPEHCTGCADRHPYCPADCPWMVPRVKLCQDR